jgi:hypothetical protein
LHGSRTVVAMPLATAVHDHLFWITSRAAGTAALLLSSAAVCVGLLMGGRLLKGRGPDLRVTHEALSLATLVALAAEMRAKVALLSGPDCAREWLPAGGVIVLDDGSYEVVASR